MRLEFGTVPRESAALIAALARQFESLHDVEHLLVVDCRFGAALQRVAEIGVEIAIVGGRRWNATVGGCAVSIDLSEHAPVFFGLGAPRTLFRNVAEAQADFLGIEGILGEGAFVAEHYEASPRCGGENAGAEGGAHIVRIVEKDIECIVGCAATFISNVGVDRCGQAKELKSVVDEVRRDVEKNSGAGNLLLAPGVGFEIGAEAIVVRFEPNDASERACGGELEDALEVAVVAAALVNGEQAAASFCELDEIEGLRHGGGERLVDEDVAACGEALMRERIMRLIGSGNNDELDLADREEFVQRSNDARVWIRLSCLGAGALQDGREAQAGNRADYRRVERASGKAEADQADVNCFARGLRGHRWKDLIERKRNRILIAA